MKSVWHLIHLTGIFFLTFLGGYDWIILPLPLFVKEILEAVNEFLIGPLLFLVMGILQQFLLENKVF
jgi:hypothetical protein